MKKILFLSFTIFFIFSNYVFGQFTPGNLVIYRIGDGTTALSNLGNVVYLDEYTTAGTFVSTVALPVAVMGNNQPLYASGLATSEGLITLSQDGRFLCFAGYGMPNGANITTVANSSVTRVAGLVNFNKAINTSVFFSSSSEFASGSNPRGAASIDGSQLWLTGGNNGLRYVKNTAATGTASTSIPISTTINNYRGINLNYDNINAQYQLYISTNSGSAIGIGAVGSGEPIVSGQIVTNLPNTPTGTQNPLQLVHLTVANIPVVYYLDNNIGSTAGSFIYKYIYNTATGNWDAKGSITLARNGVGLTATVVGTTVTLYATATNGSISAPGGVLYNLTDAFANTSSITGTAINLPLPNFSFLDNKTFRGIAFAPLATAISMSNPGNQTFCNDGTLHTIYFNSSANTTVNWTVINSTIAGFSPQSGNGNINFTATSVGLATVIATAYYGDKSAKPDTINITVNALGTWTGGALSTDWNDNANWCGGVPTSNTNAMIPIINNGFYPNLTKITTGFVNNITINNGANIINNGALNIHGAIINNGFFDTRAGTIEMAASVPQNIGGNLFVGKSIYNLIDSNTSATGVTITDTLNIIHLLSFDYSLSTINTNNVLVLVSNSAGTASVGPISELSGIAQNIINGNVIVQRYFVNHRRWRFITAPIKASTAQTINNSWQHGGVSVTGLSNPNPFPGYGTHITGPARGSYQSGLGYDQSPTNFPSITIINGQNLWTALPNTNTTKVTDYQGYMLFVRGARDYDIGTTTQYVQAADAVLQTTGQLKTGIQTIATTNGTTVIGNPYASTINFSTIYLRNTLAFTNGSFYLWDPNIASNSNLSNNGTGGWITLMYNISTGKYLAVPDPTIGAIGIPVHPFDINGDIQSGAAFLTNTSGTMVMIDEADKILDTSTTYLFRPIKDTVSMLRTTLYATSTDSLRRPIYIADGVLNIFDKNNTNEVNWNKDVQKQTNLNEQFSILKERKLISIEKSKPVNVGDSILFNLVGLKKTAYRFDFIASNFSIKNVTAFLIDRSLNTALPIHLGDSTTIINFTVNEDSTSFSSNRFYVLFKQNNTIQKDTTIIQNNNKSIFIYPNPVKAAALNVQFNNCATGIYTINIFDVLGKCIIATSINNSLATEKQVILFNKKLAKGDYILRILDPNKKVTTYSFIKE